ncbi:MAG: TetR/AcrR family transcriptional regulator [Sphingomonadaceae bacterium]|nr:TetR/AcrR family transcriptional regulator [Sphingomonadaceae bacterium]
MANATKTLDEPRNRSGLREDARKNRQKILAAARLLYTEQGTDVPHEIIASNAGVGVATLFRHFPSRTHILQALVEERFADFHDLVDSCLKTEDAWQAIEKFVKAVVAFMGDDQIILSAVWGNSQIPPPTIDERLVEGVAKIVGRAHDSGVLRKDISPADLMVLSMRPPMPRRGPGEPVPDVDRLFVEVLLRGIRQ